MAKIDDCIAKFGRLRTYKDRKRWSAPQKGIGGSPWHRTFLEDLGHLWLTTVILFPFVISSFAFNVKSHFLWRLMTTKTTRIDELGRVYAGSQLQIQIYVNQRSEVLYQKVIQRHLMENNATGRGSYLMSVMEHDNSFHDRRPFIWLPAQAKWVNVIICSNRYLTKQLQNWKQELI